jgi:hypothetical protein
MPGLPFRGDPRADEDGFPLRIRWLEPHVLRQFVERDDLIRQIAEDAGRAFEIAAGADAWTTVDEIIDQSLAVNDPKDAA